MSTAELEALLLGLLRLWQVEGNVHTARMGESVSARIEGGSFSALNVTWLRAPFGIAWQVQAEGERLRTYPSIIGLIRHLRHAFAPDRDAGQVLFVQSAGE